MANVIIGIAGGTSSGKTTVAKKVYDATKDDRVVFLTNNRFYENYLVDEGFENDIISAINKTEDNSNFFDGVFLKVGTWSQYKSQKQLSFSNFQEERIAALKFYLSNHKTEVAKNVALEICANHKKEELPNAIIQILQKV